LGKKLEKKHFSMYSAASSSTPKEDGGSRVTIGAIIGDLFTDRLRDREGKGGQDHHLGERKNNEGITLTSNETPAGHEAELGESLSPG